jgi:HemY protein
VIEKTWTRMPHPQLAILWRSGESDPTEACRQIEKLCRDNEDAPVSRLAMAEAAFAADIWGETRRHLMTLISRGEVTQSVYRLMARLERRESGDEQAALQWMTRAADAPPDPVWLCQTCGGAHTEWQALCAHCGSFSTLHWQSPGVSRGQAPGTIPGSGIIGELMAPQEF